MVSTRYIIISLRAVVAILGLSLSMPIPDVSAENILLLRISPVGTRAKVNTTIPRPPIHCVMHRQNLSPWLSPSMSDITEAPVVVNPDMASNMASSILIPASNMYGIMPISEKSTHVSVTTMKLSAREKYLLWSSLACLAFHLPMLSVMPPITKLSAAHAMNTHQSFSLWKRLTAPVISRNTDSN